MLGSQPIHNILNKQAFQNNYLPPNAKSIISLRADMNITLYRFARTITNENVLLVTCCTRAFGPFTQFIFRFLGSIYNLICRVLCLVRFRSARDIFRFLLLFSNYPHIFLALNSNTLNPFSHSN